MLLIYIPGLDAAHPGESLAVFNRGLRGLPGAGAGRGDDPALPARRVVRLDGRDIEVCEVFWGGAAAYGPGHANLLLRFLTGLRTFADWIANPRLWTAMRGRGGAGLAVSVLVGFLVFALWATSALVVFADVIAPAQAGGAHAGGLWAALWRPGVLGLPLAAVLGVAVLLSLLRADRNVMLSALLADVDRDRDGLRGRILADCAAQLDDVLAARGPGPGMVLVGHSLGGAFALDLAARLLDRPAGATGGTGDIAVVTLGCPVRIFRSGDDAGTGAGRFAAAHAAPPALGGAAGRSADAAGARRLAWADLYSDNDLFSAPMFDAGFDAPARTADGRTARLAYRPLALAHLNRDAGWRARFTGESHRAYLSDPETLAAVRAALAEAAGGRP